VLSKFNELLEREGLLKAAQFVDENPHPSLWRIVAEKALLNLDFLIAEKSLIKIDDYKTLKYVKKIQQLDDREKQKAEVLILYHKYDAAENIYRNL
jgi:WD repeat-containing protein 35